MASPSYRVPFDAERILESITDAFYALDTEWRFIYVNAEAERLLLRKRDDLLGKCVWHEFAEAVDSSFYVEYHRAIAEQVAVSVEEFYPPLSTWFHVRAYPSPYGLAVYFRNVNDLKAAEAEREQIQADRANNAIRDSEERYRLLVEGARDYAMIMMDPVGRITSWNSGAERILGWAELDVLGKTVDCIFTQQDIVNDVPTREISVAAAAGKAMDLRQHQKRDGSLFWADGVMDALYDDTGQIRGFAKILRDVTETKRAQEALLDRERNIATQLQAALQPELPEQVPGLDVARYYAAALGESDVGGDFYDVFDAGKGCTILVVGDLSGKGLAAASQVATVRNMLRAFLYSKDTIQEAVTDLNHTLASYNLLSGFATLFVGGYEPATRMLAYINCGQEPALVKRAATGLVEQLEPTGPILGTLDNVWFTEKKIALSTGDVLAIFSDGITEVGASRRAMLGTDGVAALLSELPLSQGMDSAEAIATGIMRGVETAARDGVVRDDVCLLVAIVS